MLKLFRVVHIEKENIYIGKNKKKVSLKFSKVKFRKFAKKNMRIIHYLR